MLSTRARLTCRRDVALTGLAARQYNVRLCCMSPTLLIPGTYDLPGPSQPGRNLNETNAT